MRNTSLLDNGLRVVTESIPGSRSVCIGILVAAGPQQEPDDKAGLAHLTEHGFFLGTSGRDSRGISRLADETCGRIGAFTSRDYTCFYAHIMHDYRPFAWDLLGDILLNSTFPEDRILSERNVIMQEIGSAHDNPQSRLNDVLKRSIWSDHPLGRPVAGDVDSVSRLTREDVIYFVGQNYIPDRMIVAAVGDLDHDSTVTDAQDSFWRLLGNSKPNTPAECEFKSSVLVQNSGVSQAYFSIAFPGRKYNSPDRYGLHALNTLLGGGMSSRLYTRLREKLSAVYEIGSSFDSYNAAGALIIDGATSPEYLPHVTNAIMQEIIEIAHDGIDEEELHRTKMQMIGQHQLATDSNHTRMSRLLTQQFYFDRTLDEGTILGAIEELSRESIQKEAQLLLESNTRAMATLAPENSEIHEEDLQEILFQDSSLVAHS